MDDLTRKINELISRYEKMSSDEFVEYFAEKIGAVSVDLPTPRTFRMEPIDSAKQEIIEAYYIRFPHIEKLPIEARSYYLTDKPVNDEDYDGYSLCA